MNQILELRVEVEAIKPDTPTKIKDLIKEAVNESFSQSGLEKIIATKKPILVFEQHLPTTDDLTLLISIIQLVISADPLFLSRLKSFFEYFFLNQKLRKAAPSKINVTLSIGDKKIEVKNCDPGDAVKIITKEYEVLLNPRL